MAGFLDKKEQIIDFCLTKKGKEFLSKNKLTFRYFSFFDDEVDYNPYIALSSSYTAEQLQDIKRDQTEESLVREVIVGNENSILNDRSCANSNLFSVGNKQNIVPKIKIVGYPTGSIELFASQDRITRINVLGDEILYSENSGFDIRDSTKKTIDITYTDDINNQRSSNGFVLEVFKSGSSGYTREQLGGENVIINDHIKIEKI